MAKTRTSTHTTASIQSAKKVRDKVEPSERSHQLEGLSRVVTILDLLGASDDSLSLAEICRRTDLRKSTAHRALMAMELTGLVERAPSHRFRLGLKLYDMGHRAVEQMDLRARVNPHLRRLALRIGETVHLGVLRDAFVVYIDKVEPVNRRVCISSRTGNSNPAYCTSLGKAMLAHLPAEEASKIISRTHFKSYTQKTLKSRDELRTALDRVRQRGFALDDQEMEVGTRCIGAPILDSLGRPTAAVSVSGPILRITPQRASAIAVHLVRCCKAITDDLKNIKPFS